jgi:cardiolipin synthase
MELLALLLVVGERVLAVAASVHVVLHKRDVRAAVGWAGLIWLAPLAGSVAYWLLGINRIARRAHRLRPEAARPPHATRAAPLPADDRLAQRFPELIPLGRLVGRVSREPLTAGNRVVPLVNGDAAYPVMLEAIAAARHSVALATYIFDVDRAGRQFLAALQAAKARGVAVRVLIDGVGQRYSRPPMTRLLRAAGIPTGRFLASALPLRNRYFNLRNHRKLLVADGRVGFTGGLNIREGCLLALAPRHPVQDLHFRLEGPVVRALMEAFAVDWAFTAGERLAGEAWFPDLPRPGDTLARGVPDGPDEDFESLQRVLLGALAQARRRVCICTPYFVPNPTLLSALTVAAAAGVAVEILIPERPNLRFVQWAAAAQLEELLEAGCRVFLGAPPFDHTKLMLVDGAWALFGSANWDARSLRLNFELDVECYDRALVTELLRHTRGKMRSSRELTLAEVRAWPVSRRLRNGVVRLFSPYL